MNDYDILHKSVVIPGQKLRTVEGLLRGHGTYEEQGFIYAAIAGVVEVVDKLVYVRPLRNSKYDPEVGDVVVGRIVEVGSDRWRVDIRSNQRGQLQLAAINLPGGEQRRRNADDQLDMRRYYQEGDCVSLEVQRVQSDGGVQLHTRNAKYGTLRNGCLVTVPPSLVRRQPNHMVDLECGVHVVLGNNGMIWIGHPPQPSKTETLNFADCQSQDKTIPVTERRKICRVRNIILALARVFIPISYDTINFMYTQSESQNIPPKNLLDMKIIQALSEALLACQMNDN